MPLFISFPRTGAHWLNCVMELYFDRPRLRADRATFLDRERNDWMWFHDHDMDLDIVHPDTIYLYREPVSTVYSNLVYSERRGKEGMFQRMFPGRRSFGEKVILKHCRAYREHLTKWLLSEQRARTVVRHERFKTERVAEFGKVCVHFGQPFDQARMERAFGTVSRDALVAVTGSTPEMGAHMLGPEYSAKRGRFSEEWAGRILEEVILPELEEFFDD